MRLFFIYLFSVLSFMVNATKSPVTITGDSLKTNNIAEIKTLALIGDEKICDLLTVDLSSNANFDLLERAEINKVIKEHKLSESRLGSGELAKLFPHVDAFAIIQGKRLIVFNARNGFRLMDIDCEDIAEYAKLIRFAVKKLTAKNPVYVSIISVRDIGVPGRCKAKIEEFTRELRQTLMKQANIQMLERSHLELVNDERALTGQRYDLKSSARLLTLEFEPARKDAIVNVKLIVRDLGNATIGAAKVSDGFKSIPTAVKELSRDLLPLLIKKQAVSAKAQREAKRFMKEYQRLTRSQGSGQRGELEKFRKAKDKLSSALALAPYNKDIRYAELIYYGKMLRGLSLKDKPAAMREQFQRAKKFRADFGICKPTVFETNIICGEVATNYAHRWTKEFITAYSSLCREWRPLYIAEAQKNYYPYDLSDGINSLKELDNFHSIIVRSNWPSYYSNQCDWLRQRLTDYDLLYHETVKYLASHPQEAKKINKTISECFLADPFYPNRPVDDAALAEHLEQTVELCRFVSDSKLDSIKPTIFLLDAMREAVKVKTEENFALAIDNYLQRLGAFKPELLEPRRKPRDKRFKGSSPYWALETFCANLIKKRDLVDQRLKIYQQKHSMNSEFEDIEKLIMDALNSKKPEAFKLLARKVDTIKKFNLQRMKSNNFGNRCSWLVEKIWGSNDRRDKQIDPEKLKFFFELNSDFDITTKAYYELPGASKLCPRLKLRGAAQCENEVVLFFENKQLFIRKENGSFEKISSPSEKLLIPYKGQEYSEWKRPIALSNGHIVFVDLKNNLNIYDRAGKKWLIRKDFSSEPVRSLLIHRDKIYALAGDEEWAIHNRPNYMFRCNLDGSDREILFSSERSEKLNELDKLRGGLSGLTAIGDNKLAFLLTYTNKRTYIWEYDIEKDSFKQLYKAPYSGTNNDAMWRGRDDSLYLSSCSWSERLYRFKPKAYKAEWIFAQSGRKYKFDSPDDKPAFFKGGSQLRPPWRVCGNCLWCGGANSAFLDLNSIKANPPLLLLPCANYVFELDSGRMLFLGKYRYFIINLKKQHCALKK